MKLNIQKRVLPLLCVLALVIACSFGVPAGAWTIDDDPDSIVEYYNAFNLYFDADMGSIFGLTEYAPGEWPETYTVTNLNAGTYTPFKITDLPFKADYGACFIFMLPVDIVASSNSVRVCVQALAINVNTVAEYKWTSGEVVVTSGGNGAVFGEDVSAFFFQDGEFCLFYIQGSLIRDVSSAHIQIDLMEYDEYPEAYTFDYSAATPVVVGATANSLTPPSVDSVTVSPVADGPYYPGSSVELDMTLSGTNIVPGSPESTVYWYLHGNTSDDTYLDADMYGDAVLHIANDETATSIDIEVISTYDTTKSAVYTVPITYPLDGVTIIPSGEEFLPQSGKDRTIQYSLLLPNGVPYEYELIQWIIEPTGGHEEYFSVDDVGMVTIKGGAPAGSGYTLRWCYMWDTENVAPGTAALTIISNDEAILDGGSAGENLGNKGDELDDMNDQLGGAMDELNNAQGALPTLPGDASTLVDVGLLDNSITLMTTILDYEAMGLGDLFPVLGLVAGLAVLLFIIFGKTGG